MKEKILEALKTKFVGFDASILDRIATKAAKTITTEDEVTTYIEGVTVQKVVDAYADFRATEATKTAVQNYEKKYNIKDGKPVEGEPKPKPNEEPKPNEGEEGIPAWAKALIEDNKALKARLEESDKAKLGNQRKAKLAEVLKDAPESIKKRISNGFDRLTFKDDADFDEWLNGTKTDVETFANEYKQTKGGFTPPKGGGGDAKEVNPLVQQRIEEQTKAAEANTSTVLRG